MPDNLFSKSAIPGASRSTERPCHKHRSRRERSRRPFPWNLRARQASQQPRSCGPAGQPHLPHHRHHHPPMAGCDPVVNLP